MVNLILRLPPERHKAFKKACADQQKFMNEVANDLIQEYLLKIKAVA